MVNHSVLTDYAYSSILDMILASEIKPGERIREDLLAEKFGISRTPVREAVNQLVQNGFIVNVKRKGLYCVNITRDELLNLLDLRTALESLSFVKCIEMASDEDIQKLWGIVAEFRGKFEQLVQPQAAPRDKELAALHNEYDVRFHVSIAEISKSTRLIKYISEVENTLLIARQRIYKNVEGTSIVILSWQQHEQMLTSLEARDKTAALDILGQHLRLMKDTQVNIDESDKTG